LFERAKARSNGILLGGGYVNTYMIPREATNENKFLIFSPQAALFTLIGFGIGLCFVLIFNFISEAAGNKILLYVGWGICILIAAIGYALGTFNIPETNAFDICKKTGGESAYVVIKRAITFNKRKKIYIYERGQF